jgi:hypothetical protein
MGGEADGGTPAGAPPGATPPGWSEVDVALEQRLHADEVRLARDEARLAQDEARLAHDETVQRRMRRTEWATGGLLVLTVAALGMAWYGLNRDIDAVARADPKPGSVTTGSIRDGAVTGPKLAAGAVGTAALAAGAVTPADLAAGAVRGVAIADGAVTGRAVAPNALTGTDIAEGTLGTVPRATSAADAAALGGVPAARYVTRASVVRAASGTSTLRSKGPITATCPAGTAVIAGGGEVQGAVPGVALTVSAPAGTSGWTVAAGAATTPPAAWRLVATAVCTRGG